MNKLFSKIATLSVGLAMAAGVGVAVSHETFRETRAEAPYDFTGDTVTFSNQGLTNAVQYLDPFTNGQFSVQFSGGTNDGKYYTTGTGIRTYGGGLVTISVASGYQMTGAVLTFSGTSYAPTDTSVLSGDGSISISGTVVTWSGTSTDHFTLTRPSGSGNWRLQSVNATVSSSSSPVVSFVDAPTSVFAGDSGTFSAEGTNATSPSFTFESGDSSVLEVNADGSYSAIACGVADVTVNMTCDEGNASKTISVTVNGSDVMSVSDAVAIAESFDDTVDTVTEYTVLVKGYIVSFDESVKDSKPRAIKISDSKKDAASDTDSILAYGIYSDDPLRSYAILNGELTVRAKIENYKGTNELSSLTIEDYTDEAIAYAKTAYKSLNEACTTGPAAVTDEQWNGLASDFAALDEYARAKLADAGSDYQYSEDIANWIGRYGRIVAAGRTNFMENVNVSSQYFSNFESSNNSYIIIIVIASVSVLSFGLALALRKKRTK